MNETITNVFAEQSDLEAENWAKYSFHPSDNFAVSSCTVTPFSAADAATSCQTQDQMKTLAKGRFRSYCIQDFRPTNYLDFAISGPLTGHWFFPQKR